MAYFPELSPYDYASRPQPGVVHVGWLDHTHPFATGKVARQLADKLKELALAPSELKRGFHVCELCGNSSPRNNGEIRITYNGVTYAAPVLIVHYIETHRYLPPTAFLNALEEVSHGASEPSSPSRDVSS